MTVGTAGLQAGGGAGRAWIHLGALGLLAGAVEAAAVLSGGARPAFPALVARLPDFYFTALPVLAAISVGMLSFGRDTTRQATLLVLAVTAIMLGLDPLGGRAVQGAATTAVFPQGVVLASPSVDFSEVSLLATIWRLLHGTFPLPLVRSASYGVDDPFIVATFAVLRGAHLLLPAALIGIVLGVQAWVADHVVFRRPVDERVARIVLAWVFAPAAFYLGFTWGNKLVAQVLFGGAGLTYLLLPTGVLLLIGAVGWATARRVAQWAS